MSRVYLLSGSNLGNKEGSLSLAFEYISKEVGEVLSFTSIYETEPWGFGDVPSFFNQVLLVQTGMEPSSVLYTLLAIEKKMGRERNNAGYHSRIIDLDILFYDDRIIETDVLKVPHPLLHLRRFVLVPLCEIAADLLHPVFGKTIEQLLEGCEDKMKVNCFKRAE